MAHGNKQKSADKRQRQLIDKMLSKYMYVYTCMKKDELEPPERKIVERPLANTRTHLNPDGDWGIVLVAGDASSITAADIATLCDYIGEVPENVTKIVCAEERSLLADARDIAAEFVDAGGKILYDGDGSLGCDTCCNMDWFDCQDTSPFLGDLRYLGPVKGKLEEILVAQTISEILYDKMDDIAFAYVECGAEFSLDDSFSVTKILSYGKCDLEENLPGVSSDCEDLDVPAIIENWGDEQIERIKAEYDEIFASAIGIAEIWQTYTERYSFSLSGYNEEAYEKWAEMGELLGVKDAIALHFDHGVPIKDIIA